MKFKWFWVPIILIAGYIAALNIWHFYRSDEGLFVTHQANQKNREVLLRVRDDIHIGMDYDDVLKVVWKHNPSPSLISFYAYSPDEWNLWTPFEFGGQNWGLKVKFSNQKVTTIQIRTSDGPAPRDGPPDKT